MKFYLCEHCGKIVEVVKDSRVPLMCCGQKMTEIIPGTKDAAVEKHVPVYSVEGNKVTVSVGAVAHPMTEAHLIEWVVLETEQGVQRRNFKAGDAPKAEFVLAEGDKVTAVYAYCNLHGLWKA